MVRGSCASLQASDISLTRCGKDQVWRLAVSSHLPDASIKYIRCRRDKGQPSYLHRWHLFGRLSDFESSLRRNANTHPRLDSISINDSTNPDPAHLPNLLIFTKNLTYKCGTCPHLAANLTSIDSTNASPISNSLLSTHAIHSLVSFNLDT